MVLAQVYFALATRDQLLRQNTRTAVYNLLAPYPPIDEVNQMLVRRYTSLIHSARYCAKLTLLAAIYDEARGRDVPDATRQERVQRYLQESADIVVVDTGTSYGMHWRLDLMSNMLMISRRDMDRWRDAAEGSPLRIAVEDATEVTLGHEGFHRFGTIYMDGALYGPTKFMLTPDYEQFLENNPREAERLVNLNNSSRPFTTPAKVRASFDPEPLDGWGEAGRWYEDEYFGGLVIRLGPRIILESGSGVATFAIAPNTAAGSDALEELSSRPPITFRAAATGPTRRHKQPSHDIRFKPTRTTRSSAPRSTRQRRRKSPSTSPVASRGSTASPASRLPSLSPFDAPPGESSAESEFEGDEAYDGDEVVGGDEMDPAASCTRIDPVAMRDFMLRYMARYVSAAGAPPS